MESVSVGVGEALVHLVAPLGGAEMRQPRAGDIEMRGIPVVDRVEHAALLERGGEIHRLADAAIGDELAQRRARFDRLTREFERRPRALDEAAFAACGDDRRALAGFVDDLRESHALSLLLRRRPIHSAIGRMRSRSRSKSGALTSSRRFATARIRRRRIRKPRTWIFPPKRRRAPGRRSPGPSAERTPSSTSPQLMSMSSVMRW